MSDIHNQDKEWEELCKKYKIKNKWKRDRLLNDKRIGDPPKKHWGINRRTNKKLS